MNSNQNKIILAGAIVIIILIAVGMYIRQTSLSATSGQAKLVPCAEGDRYDLMTGKLCPGATPYSATTTEASE